MSTGMNTHSSSPQSTAAQAQAWQWSAGTVVYPWRQAALQGCWAAACQLGNGPQLLGPHGWNPGLQLFSCLWGLHWLGQLGERQALEAGIDGAQPETVPAKIVTG